MRHDKPTGAPPEIENTRQRAPERPTQRGSGLLRRDASESPLAVVVSAAVVLAVCVAIIIALLEAWRLALAVICSAVAAVIGGA